MISNTIRYDTIEEFNEMRCLLPYDTCTGISDRGDYCRYKQVRAHYRCINAETNVNTSLALSTAKAEIRHGHYDI